MAGDFAEEWHPGTWEWILGKAGRRRVPWPHSCFPGLPLLPLHAEVTCYQHAVLGSSICSIVTGAVPALGMLFPPCLLRSSKPDIISGCVCLKTVKDRKWLPQQVNTSVTEKITSSNPKLKGTALKILWNESPSHTVLSAILIWLQHQDVTHGLEGRRELISGLNLSLKLGDATWCFVPGYHVTLVGKIMLKICHCFLHGQVEKQHKVQAQG